MTTRDSSSKPKARRQGAPRTKRNFLGALTETDGGWVLRGEAAGGVNVRVAWHDPHALLGRTLVWELVGNPVKTRAKPFLLQPSDLLDAQPDGRFPAGISCSQATVHIREPTPKPGPKRGAGLIKREPISELLPLEELVTKGVIALVPAWAKGPGWKRRPAIRVICPYCPATLQVFHRYSPRGIAAVCAGCTSIWRAADFSIATQELLAEDRVQDPGGRRIRARQAPTTFKCNECLKTKPLKAFPLTNQHRCLDCGGQERSSSVRAVSGGLVSRRR